jgi:hypothetical protein
MWNDVGIKHLGAFAALASAGLLVMAAGGASAQREREPWSSFGKPWTDSADPAALKACRENIAQPSSGTKVGPLTPLRTASFVPSGGPTSMKRVPQKYLRMYAARVQTTNLFGSPIDRHDVCFFEATGKTYRFVQVCSADAGLKQLSNCNLSWVVPTVYSIPKDALPPHLRPPSRR